MLAQGEPSRHLFIVRIWFEEPDTWRGQVDHIPGGQKRYFKSLNDLNEFISLQIGQQMGCEISVLAQPIGEA